MDIIVISNEERNLITSILTKDFMPASLLTGRITSRNDINVLFCKSLKQ